MFSQTPRGAVAPQPLAAPLAVAELTYVAALEARRSRLIGLSLWIAGLGGLLALSTAEAAHVEHGRLIIDAGLMAASILGTVTAISMTLQTFAGDSEARAVTLLAVHPIARWTLLVGRALGLWLVQGVMVAVMAATTWGLLRILGEPMDLGVVQAFAILPLELAVVQATTLIFATLATRPYAALMAVGLWVAGNLSEDILLWANSPHAQGSRPILLALHAVLPDYAKLSLRGYAANAVPLPYGLWTQTAIYALSYSTVALIVAAVCFSRRKSL